MTDAGRPSAPALWPAAMSRGSFNAKNEKETLKVTCGHQIRHSYLILYFTIYNFSPESGVLTPDNSSKFSSFRILGLGL